MVGFVVLARHICKNFDIITSIQEVIFILREEYGVFRSISYKKYKIRSKDYAEVAEMGWD